MRLGLLVRAARRLGGTPQESIYLVALRHGDLDRLMRLARPLLALRLRWLLGAVVVGRARHENEASSPRGADLRDQAGKGNIERLREPDHRGQPRVA